jgi:hypothetical protein
MSKKTINNPIIWLYWENKDKSKSEPEIIRRCKEIYNKYENTIILDEITIHDYLDDLVDCSRLQYLAQKSDYYRAKLLYEYGGIWIDMDMILLDDISYLYDELMKTDFEMCGNYDIIYDKMAFNISYIVFKPKSAIAEKWVKYDEDFILSNSYVDWATLGGFGLGKVISENNYLDKVMPMPKEIGFTLDYQNKSYEKYYSMDSEFNKEKIDFIVNNKIKVITLYGTFMYNIKLEDGCLLDQMFKLKK